MTPAEDALAFRLLGREWARAHDRGYTDVGRGFFRYRVPLTGRIGVRWWWGRRALGDFCLVAKDVSWPGGLGWVDCFLTLVLICRYQPWRVWFQGNPNR